MNESNGDAAARVLAIVVTHNGQQWLRESIGSLAAQDYPNLDVVIVDSGSREPAHLSILELLPGAEIIRLEDNPGFPAACNRALEVAEKAPEADFFLFLHDDAALDEGAVAAMVSTALETEAGIVGGKGVRWDEPEVMLEVGMSADQLCYPFSGLEEGEIDQGQHDARREVLYVTSACMLVSRPLIERCGSWDGEYFAFGEDLDLCMRARLSGFRVLVEPKARFRHVAALANRIRESPASSSIRLLTRRNRPRTIAKNLALYRVGIVLIVYSFVSVGEMVLLAALRRFEEIPFYPRAFWSFARSVPEVLRRRRAVQSRRTVPDRRVRRLMVRDLHRARVFFEHHLRSWESTTRELGALALSRLKPAALKETLGGWIRKPSSIGGVVITVLLLFAARDLLFGRPLATGALWPFPASAGRLLSEYFSAWRDVGLGTEAGAPVAFPLLWVGSVIGLGDPHRSQVAVVVLLVVAGLLGMNRLIARRTRLSGPRLLAVGLYALAPGLELLVGTGDLGALAMYAGLPYILEISLRMGGPTPGPGGDRAPTSLTPDSMIRDALRLAIVTAGVIALAPSGVVAIIVLHIITGVHVLLSSWDRQEGRRRVMWIFGSLGAALVLLLPWSLEALRPWGAALGPVFSGWGGGNTFGPLWSKSGFNFFLLLGSESSLAAVPIAAVVIGALCIPGPSRRSEVRKFVLVWLGFVLLGGLASRGLFPGPVASPAVWLTIPLAAAAAIAGQLAAGAAEELPRHGFGGRHLLAALTTIGVLAGLLGAWVPALASWSPAEPTPAADSSEEAHSVISFFSSTAEVSGEFRILWLGEKWFSPVRAAGRRVASEPYLLTGPGGLSLLDGFSPSPSRGEERLDGIVQALVARRLHLAGHLLAPAGVRFVVIDAGADELARALGRQRDIALRQQQGGVAIFENLRWVPRAAVAPAALIEPSSSNVTERAVMLADWVGGRSVPKRKAGTFSAEIPRTRHDLVMLGDNFNSAWRATAGGVELKHERSFGWANRFVLPPEARGEIVIRFSGGWSRGLWLAFQSAVLLLGVAMARSGSIEIPRGLT